MAKSLLKQQIDDYQKQGYFFPIDVLNEDEVRFYRNSLEEAEALYGEQKFANTEWGLKTHLLMTCFDSLIRHPKILDVVEGILGPNLLCYESSFFSKPPRDDKFIGWHQDPTYWGLNSNDFVSVWVALSPSKVKSGCVRVLPKTHQQGIVPHIDTFDPRDMLTRGQKVSVNIDENQAVNMELEPGQASLHHVNIFHGSNPNCSDYRRIGFSIRYIPTSISPIAGTDSAMLVRGADTYGYWELEKRPKTDFEPEMIAYHQNLRDQRMNILMNLS